MAGSLQPQQWPAPLELDAVERSVASETVLQEIRDPSSAGRVAAGAFQLHELAQLVQKAVETRAEVVESGHGGAV